MAYPTDFTDFTPDPTPTSPRNNPSLAGKINLLQDVAEALETTVGITASADTNSIQYKVAANAAAAAAAQSTANGSAARIAAATAFPAALDPGANLPSSAAVLALETKVGVTNSLVAGSHSYEISQIGVTPARMHGFLTWNFDPIQGVGLTYNTAGVLQLVKLHFPSPITVTSLNLFVVNAGTSVTGSYMALYTSAGALLSQSANGGATATGLKTFALGAPQAVAAGDYYAAVWVLHSGAPQFLAASNATNGAGNINLNAPNFRFATADTGLTTTAPATLGVQSAHSRYWWVGVL